MACSSTSSPRAWPKSRAKAPAPVLQGLRGAPWPKAKFGVKRSGGINITPFVDVLLVVLVIFILTSNASIPGIKVDLPKASARGAGEAEDQGHHHRQRGQVFLDAYP
jgi:hypothetical protein